MTKLTENKTHKLIASEGFRLFLAASLILLIIIALMTCNNEPKPLNVVVDTNPLDELVKDKDAIILATMENNKVLRDSLFTLSQRKPKVIIRYKTVYDSLKTVDTACFKSLNRLNDECAKKDSVNNYIINNQSVQIAQLTTVTNNQQDIIDIRNYQHSVDSTNEVKYKAMIQDEITNGKRKYRKGLLQGGVIGLGVGVIGGILLVK
jgi:superfamily II DNA helicase RecQ